MSYAIYLDDERVPRRPVAPSGDTWVILRSSKEFFRHIKQFGPPNYVSFDHDLGEDVPTGYDVAKTWVYYDMYRGGNFTIPYKLRFNVHSANPVGAKNIQTYLDNYLGLRDGR